MACAPSESRPGSQAPCPHGAFPGAPSTLLAARAARKALPGRSPESHLLPAQACPQRGSWPSFLPLSPHNGFFQPVVNKKKKAHDHPAARARLFLLAETRIAFSPTASQRAGRTPAKEVLTLQVRACCGIIRSLSRRRRTRRLILSKTWPRLRVVQPLWLRGTLASLFPIVSLRRLIVH